VDFLLSKITKRAPMTPKLRFYYTNHTVFLTMSVLSNIATHALNCISIKMIVSYSCAKLMMFNKAVYIEAFRGKFNESLRIQLPLHIKTFIPQFVVQVVSSPS
jgi:hypothetical protein